MLIAAAFIGPGTITVCTLSGAAHGYALLWALFFSVLATIVLQEMSLRLGMVTQSGLGEAIREHTPPGLLKIVFSMVVFSAIVIGNAAYEAGNISGAVLGIDIFYSARFWPIIIGLLAFVILFFGKYDHLEKVLIVLVLVMTVCFLITAFCLKPSIKDLFLGFVPRNLGNLDFLTITALVGTTVVPYNLFLHASIISKKYKRMDQLQNARRENAVAIGLGGLTSMLIMVVAAGSLSEKGVAISSAEDMAMQLQPLLGNYAKVLFGIGLFAAGLSSAMTAPLAAAYAASGIFGWKSGSKNRKFKVVWMSILGIGILLALTNVTFIGIIKFAQIANGILLPVVACYLLFLVNQKGIMGKHINGILANVISIVVIGLTLLLSIRTFVKIFALL